MLKIALVTLVLTSFYGCAMTPLPDSYIEEYNRKQSLQHNTNNMSDFDRQQFYTHHNLGPVPAQPVIKPNRNTSNR